ncbi:MAG: hypothetical protein ISP01_07160 [Methanobrevibacter arboriphilus]|uniref:Uncharacterized protein n=1 Tax=Methanobrevibacter arboriphilus TaxID=39441 RepID=A0A843APJ0_METAZ|nr:hypothetical protein [Methanobrevibacter arboriphilus]MBF4469169.1 hypothetical protein [Methanobrevibacter arboriphilus]
MSIFLVYKDVENSQIILGHDCDRPNDSTNASVITKSAIKTRNLIFKNLKEKELDFHISIFNASTLYDVIEFNTDDLVIQSNDFSYKSIKKFILNSLIPRLVKVFDKYKYNQTNDNGIRDFSCDILIIVGEYVFHIDSKFSLYEAFYEGYDKDFFILGNGIDAGYGIIQALQQENPVYTPDRIMSEVIIILSGLKLYVGECCRIYYFKY